MTLISSSVNSNWPVCSPAGIVSNPQPTAQLVGDVVALLAIRLFQFLAQFLPRPHGIVSVRTFPALIIEKTGVCSSAKFLASAAEKHIAGHQAQEGIGVYMQLQLFARRQRRLLELAASGEHAHVDSSMDRARYSKTGTLMNARKTPGSMRTIFPSRIDLHLGLYSIIERKRELVGRASKRILRLLQRRGVITLVTAPGDGKVTIIADETMGEEGPLLARCVQ
jgi:hypothetical protein